MIPFCRSTKEADRVLAVMAENRLRRGENGLQVFVMCENIDSISISADSFIVVKQHVAAREAAARTGRRGGEC
jgi:hypothetical protein